MKRRMLILAPIVLGLLCTMVIGVQTAKADVNCDLNNDGLVDLKDIVRVAIAFGARLGDQKWDSESDLDANGNVNLKDIGLVARRFGQMSGPVFVVPEYPIGPILGLAGFFAALGIFRLIKKSKHDWHFLKR